MSSSDSVSWHPSRAGITVIPGFICGYWGFKLKQVFLPTELFLSPTTYFWATSWERKKSRRKNLLKFLKQAKSRGTDCTLVGGSPVLPWVFYSYYRVFSALWLIHSQVFIVISLLIFISDTSLLAQGWWLFCVLTLVDFWELGGFSVCIYIISKQQQFDSLSTWVLVISLAGLLWLKLLKVKEVVILFLLYKSESEFSAFTHSI